MPSRRDLSQLMPTPTHRPMPAPTLHTPSPSALSGLGGLPELNTVVLSSNNFDDLGQKGGGMLQGCAALTKLSASHNALRALGGALRGCPALAELRLSHNRLRGLPAELASNAALRIVDVGSNRIASLDDVKASRLVPCVLGCVCCHCLSSPSDRPATLPMMIRACRLPHCVMRVFCRWTRVACHHPLLHCDLLRLSGTGACGAARAQERQPKGQPRSGGRR